jgi:hypothetical protein
MLIVAALPAPQCPNSAQLRPYLLEQTSASKTATATGIALTKYAYHVQTMWSTATKQMWTVVALFAERAVLRLQPVLRSSVVPTRTAIPGRAT